jgi:hypothetical protein
MPRRKENKILRYTKIYWRGILRLRFPTVKRFLKRNIKGHPFVSGTVFFFWITRLIRIIVINFSFKSIIKITLLALFVWLVFVWLNNLLKDKNARWYFRKKFVFVLLIFYAPAGIVFLWAGSKFKRITKTVLTVVFSLIFTVYYAYISKNLEGGFDKTTMSLISEMINKTRDKVFLKNINLDLVPVFKNKFSYGNKNPKKMTVEEIAGRFAPCVASITTKDRKDNPLGKASGFVISSDGLIVTNFHVVEKAFSAEVILNNIIFDEVYLVRVIPKFDIAILKINAFGLRELSFGDSDFLNTGEPVVAIGNPLGLDRSVSNGIISGIRNESNIKVIQMTAPVSAGSSGGPIFNERGEVIGITTLATIFGAQNLNFAIPINYLKSIYPSD